MTLYEFLVKVLQLPTIRDSADTQTLEDMVAGLEDGIPEVPATPTEQDIVDALVTLGLVTQAEE